MTIATTTQSNVIAIGTWFTLAFVASGVLAVFLFARPVGIWPRCLRLAAVLALAIFALAGAQIASKGEHANAIAAFAGIACALAFGGIRARRRRRANAASAAARPRLWRPVDYTLGLLIYGGCCVGIAFLAKSAHPTSTEAQIAAALGLFIYSQLSVSLVYRLFNQALRSDYGVGIGGHYLLAGIPIVLAAGVHFGFHLSIAGPAFRLALLAIAWRFTGDRPTSVVRTVFALARRRGRGATATAAQLA